MNTFKAKLTAIKKHEGVSEIQLQTGKHALVMVALELSDTLTVGLEVILSAKATHIALATQIEGFISIANRLHVSFLEVVYGEILCSVQLLFEDQVIESIITTSSASKMDIKAGDHLIALIKSSDLSIAI